MAFTLEHAYPGMPSKPYDDHGFQPKLPKGTYTCKRGMHRLHGMDKDFETFEILGVPGCTGILFHWGNFNRDSEGCVLVGHGIEAAAGHPWMVTESRATFGQLMQRLQGLDTFELIVA